MKMLQQIPSTERTNFLCPFDSDEIRVKIFVERKEKYRNIGVCLDDSSSSFTKSVDSNDRQSDSILSRKTCAMQRLLWSIRIESIDVGQIHSEIDVRPRILNEKLNLFAFSL